MMKKLSVGCVGVAVLASAGITQADTIGMTFDGITGQSTSYSYTGVRAAGGASFGGNTTAGKFAWTVTTGGGTCGNHAFAENETCFTFCTELTQNISQGSKVLYTLQGPSSLPDPSGGFGMGSFRAALLAELFDNHFVAATTAAGTLDAAAFQMAVWEIVYQDGTGAGGSASSLGELTLDTLAGTYSTGNNVAGALANSWFIGLTGSYATDPDWLVGFGSTTKQDQITMVPLPAPVWMAAVGLLGVVVGRRRLGRVAV